MPPVAAIVQVRRLLVMIPWLTARGSVSIADLAKAFGISEEQAEADVQRASMIGVEPFTHDCCVFVYLDGEGGVGAYPGQYLERPPKLTAAQGFALLAAGRAILGERHGEGDATVDADGDGPLASALDKLETVLGDASVVNVDLQRPSNLDEVRAAAEQGTQLKIRYYSAWRDEETEREVDPQVVFQRHGRWYVQAWCHRAVAVRRFRVDRIRSLRATGVTFTPADVAPPDDVWDPGPDAQRVVLDIPASERWVVEAYPVEWEERDGRLLVTMNVLGTAWLERLLLKVGPEARVVEPDSLRTLGADAARRLLASY